MSEFASGLVGVLPIQWLRKAVEEGLIRSDAYRIPPSSLQPASIDLRLGDRAYRLRSSFLPESENVEEKLPSLVLGPPLSLEDGAVLEQNRPYLIPLVEELRLPETLRARANPRSSTGRLDIFTRVITDQSHTFDEIRAGYKGRLYLEVVSRSFTIMVKEGLSLNQLRLLKGNSRVSDHQITASWSMDPLLFGDGRPVAPERLTVSNGLFLSLDLEGSGNRPVGYRAKKNSQLLDLAKLYHYQAHDFWAPVHSDADHRLILEPEEFYLLLSREAVRIPPKYAAEMTAYDPTSGELRTHYAGFFDPGFGYDETGLNQGTRAALEVRAHDVPFMIEEGQRVCRLGFEEMAEEPTSLYGGEIGSTYQGQSLMLSKHFTSQQPPPSQLRLSDLYNPQTPRM
jgi:dCTP deaminase